MLRKAAVKGEAELFAVHSALSVDEGYRQTMQTAAGLDYSPEATSAAAARTERLRAVQEEAQSFDAKADAAVTAFLSGTKRTPPRVPGKAALARAERVAQLAADPAALQELLTTGTATLGETAPATSAAVMEAAQRAVAFLADKAPRPPPPALDVPALRRPFRPAAAEVARCARYVAAEESPAGVLEDMAAGAVTAEAVEALRTVYPALYAEVRERLVQRLAEHGSAMDYRQRLSLGFLLDFPADPSLSPATIARLQQAHSVAEPKQPRRRASPSESAMFEGEGPSGRQAPQPEVSAARAHAHPVPSGLVSHVVELLLRQQPVVGHHLDAQHSAHLLPRAVVVSGPLVLPHQVQCIREPVGAFSDAPLYLAQQRKCPCSGAQGGFHVADADLYRGPQH